MKWTWLLVIEIAILGFGASRYPLPWVLLTMLGVFLIWVIIVNAFRKDKNNEGDSGGADGGYWFGGSSGGDKDCSPNTGGADCGGDGGGGGD